MEEKRPFPGKILLVDDETNIREGLKAILHKNGHEVQDVATAWRPDNNCTVTVSHLNGFSDMASHQPEYNKPVLVSRCILDQRGPSVRH